MPPARTPRTPRRSSAASSSSASPATPRIAAAAALAAAKADLVVQESTQAIYDSERAARPSTTQRAYNPKQLEFRDWCDEMEFALETRYIVTGEKIAVFIQQCVINRAPRKRGPKPKEGSKRRGKSKVCTTATAPDADGGQDDDGELDVAGRTVGASCVQTYIAAITDLYVQQKALKINSHPRPRDVPALQAVIQTAKRRTASRKKDEYIDRGIGSLQDGYHTNTMLGKILNSATARNTAAGLRDRTAMAFGHYGLMRSNNILGVQLADLSSIELEREGHTPYFAVITLLGQGKTNQDGRQEYGAFMRSKDVEVCGVGALAFLLFYRFHLANEEFPPQNSSFPSFADSRDWFDIYLFRATKGAVTDQVQYAAFYESVSKSLKVSGLNTHAQTHVFRGSGARMADLGGASKGDIRQAGRWNQQTMDRCYLTTLARQVMRVHAGFDPKGGLFFLPRAITVPDELSKQVFPEADEWLRRVAEGDECTPSIAARGFLDLLVRLRDVLLQDAACLRKLFPQHPLFLHPLFSSPAFLAFESAMEHHVATVPNPLELQLQTAMPHLTTRMDTGFEAQAQKTAELGAQVTLMKSTLTAGIEGVRTLLTDFLTGGVPIRLAADFSALSATGTSGASAAAGLGATRSSAVGVPAAAAAPPAPFRMSRNIMTVDQAVREWRGGLGGGLSVEEAYRPGSEGYMRMKQVGAEDKHYRRRHKLIDKIDRIVREKKVTEEVAVRSLEAYRGKRSLAKLQEELSRSPLVEIPLVYMPV